MTGAIDLSPAHLAIVERILAEHVPECEVRAFGSRATWTARDYSDLDLAVVGEGPLPWRTLSRLREAFEESRLAMRVDVLDWHDISQSFQQVIQRDYVVLQEGQGQDKSTKWAPIVLGESCTKIGSGATPRGGKDSYLESGPYTLIRSQNVYNAGFRQNGLAFIDHAQADALRSVEVAPDDVLLNITGDSVARVCQVDPEVLPARVNQHVAIIRPDPARLDARFLRYYLTSPEVQAMLLSWAGSGGTRNALTKKMIESIEVKAPSDVREQCAIAHVLGTLDDKIELNRRMNETLEAMARALFRSWFVDFEPVRAKMEGRWRSGESLPGLPAHLHPLFPDRLVPSELGDIPEGWEVRGLDGIADFTNGTGAPAVPARWRRVASRHQDRGDATRLHREDRKGLYSHRSSLHCRGWRRALFLVGKPRACPVVTRARGSQSTPVQGHLGRVPALVLLGLAPRTPGRLSGHRCGQGNYNGPHPATPPHGCEGHSATGAAS